MSPSTSRAKPRRTVANEEERAWISFYQRVGHDAALAAEVLAQLEADPEMKRLHLALYLSCRESLRSQAARGQRNERIGRFVRRMLHALFVKAPMALGRALRRGGDVAVACLPEADVEPARAQVQRLVADPEFGAVRGRFDPTPAPPSPADTGAETLAAPRLKARAVE